jgi:hypothetical protein
MGGGAGAPFPWGGVVRPRVSRLPVAQWPPWVWAELTPPIGGLADSDAFGWCERRGYDFLQVLAVARAHRLALAGIPAAGWLRCPCPMHGDGSPFPTPAEMDRRWRRGPWVGARRSAPGEEMPRRQQQEGDRSW